MRILFDINILLDVAIRWKEFPGSLTFYDAVVRDPQHRGGLPACGYTTIYYLLEKNVGEAKARAFLQRFVDVLQFLPFAESTAAVAHKLEIDDLEDACIAATALEADFDVIVTRNVSDFAGSPVPAKSPTTLLKAL